MKTIIAAAVCAALAVSVSANAQTMMNNGNDCGHHEINTFLTVLGFANTDIAAGVPADDVAYGEVKRLESAGLTGQALWKAWVSCRSQIIGPGVDGGPAATQFANLIAAAMFSDLLNRSRYQAAK